MLSESKTRDGIFMRAISLFILTVATSLAAANNCVVALAFGQRVAGETKQLSERLRYLRVESKYVEPLAAAAARCQDETAVISAENLTTLIKMGVANENGCIRPALCAAFGQEDDDMASSLRAWVDERLGPRSLGRFKTERLDQHERFGP